jgi:CLIP-associating protein 1/2
MQISDEANRCINVLLAKYDHFRCLAVCPIIFLLYIIVNFVSNWCKCATNFISWSSVLMQVVVPLLVSDDEKTLVVSINCLTKVSHITF